MASYHLSVKTIKRSAGRSVTAAAAYRAGERIECQREGRLHDYTRKQGIEETFIVAPERAPAWAQDRSALWNAAEASETRRNSVTGREWELALPSEIGAAERSRIVRDFAQELVGRYGVAVDVAIHAPHREGDQRNHHAHVLTTTRQLEPEGFTAKTRVLDSAKTGGVEIEQMRGVWAELQNRALERVGEIERVDHRSLEKQRETALDRGEKASAAREGREYVPVTERGAVVHAARQAREAFRDMRERLDVARETYGLAREEGQGRVSAGLAALRAAAAKDRGSERETGDFRERLVRITGRGDAERDGLEPEAERTDRNRAQERLRETLGKDRGDGIERDGNVERDGDKPSIRERLDAVLNKPRERLDIEDEPKKGREVENEREIDREVDRDRGLSH